MKDSQNVRRFWMGMGIGPLLITILACAPRHGAVFPDKEWMESLPEEQGIDSEKLQEAIGFLREHSGENGVGELVIVRNGYLIWKGDNIDHQHGIWSMTKSFTSTVLGLLIEDGKCSLETKAFSFIPAMSLDYSEATLRHFTTMTSGYTAVGDDRPGSYRHGPSRTPFEPGPQPLFPPGTKFAYWDSAMNQFANILTHIADEPLESLFKRRIADPIGMDPDAWRWGYFDAVDGIRMNGGAGNNSKHLYISAREVARFGWLFLNEGNWDGDQLISRDWIIKATSVHVPTWSNWIPERSPFDGRGYYGFNWWCNGIGSNGSRKWPGAPASTYAASGYNNNDLFILPDWNVVIVRLGLDEGDYKITDAEYGEFLRLVGLSLSET